MKRGQCIVITVISATRDLREKTCYLYVLIAVCFVPLSLSPSSETVKKPRGEKWLREVLFRVTYDG